MCGKETLFFFFLHETCFSYMYWISIVVKI